MILILSNNSDISTNEVIDWLIHYNCPFIRINETDVVRVKQIDIDQSNLKIILTINHKKEIDLSQITSYWYRRGFFNLNLHQKDISIFSKINPKLDNYNLNFHRQEYESLIDFLHLYLKSKKHISTYYDDGRINKLYALRCASLAGLKVPRTKVLTCFEEGVPKKAINKAIRQGFGYVENDFEMLGFTEKANKSVLTKHNEDNFFPSLFQEEIEKQFEIRTFFLHDKMYSMAIFSQNNEKTKVDFRRYDTSHPNRTVPFLLPNEIKEKLIELMQALDINSGSIDLLVDINDDFYFLEVNPVGQFKQVSIPCNYNIEKHIAKHLSNDKGNKRDNQEIKQNLIAPVIYRY